MDFITKMFEAISSGLTKFFEMLGKALNGVSSLVWQTGESSTGGSLTFFGSLLIIALVFGLGYMVFNLIRRLISSPSHSA